MNNHKAKLFALLSLALLTLLMLSCSEDREDTNYSVHPSNWMDPYSQEWHGTAALESKGQSCAECHNTDVSYYLEYPDVVLPPAKEFVSNVRCAGCHAYPHAQDYSSQHKWEIQYGDWQNLPRCQACHGVDFAGGNTGSSCLNCHTEPGGPAACITCHGTPPIEPMGSVPPGAHGAHSRYACTECHREVEGLDHIGGFPAEVDYSDAVIAGANNYQPAYIHRGSFDSGNGTCATWCHSDLHQGAPLVAVEWATGQTITQCRGCHQVPPTAPFHPTGNRCHECHPHVDPNSNYNDANEIRFLDPSLHVNGVVNATFP